MRRPVTPMICRAGFFHFVADHAHPLDQLKKSLTDSATNVSEALIVLPEAFNIAADYWRPLNSGISPANTDCGIIPRLQCICEDFKVSFVAGLIVDMSGSPNPPHNSAWLIDSTGASPLSVKLSNDGTGAGPRGRADYANNYTPCLADCDIDNGIPYRNLTVGALLCMDAYLHDSVYGSACRVRHDSLKAKIAQDIRPKTYRVICVPSRM